MNDRNASRRPLRRRLLASALGLGFALVAFEVVMQLLALGLWLFGDRAEPAAADGQAKVLAIGDSFTFGLGASGADAAYPAALQRHLDRARPDRFRVINAGRPGTDSSQLLRRLPGLLERHAPTEVCVLIGYNDRWATPSELAIEDVTTAAADDAEGFPWKLRTLLLAQRIVHWVANAGESETEAGTPPSAELLHGRWRSDVLEATFRADGVCEILGITAPFRTDGNRLWIGPDEDAAIEYRFEIATDVLTLEGGQLPESGVSLRRTATADEVPGGGPSRDTGSIRLLEAAQDAPRLDAAEVRKACEALASQPNESELWWRLIIAGREGLERPHILATIGTALPQLDPADPWRAGLLRARAILLEDTDPEAALDAVLSAWRIDEQVPPVTATLRALFGGREAAALDESLARIDASPEVRERARKTFAAAADAAHTVPRVLESHLLLAAELCRRRGARMWLIDYPETVPEVSGAIAAAAQRGALPRVEVTAAFTEHRRQHPSAELFVSDGHCNSAGYELLGKTVAAQLLAAPAAAQAK